MFIILMGAHASRLSNRLSARGAGHEARRPFGLAKLALRSASHPSSSWIEPLALQKGGKRHEKRETNIVASFSSGRCKHRPACNGCRRPAASSCQPRSQERSKLTKDQLPETGPDGCGQANQSVIHDARRHREPGMAQGVNPKGDEPSGTLPRTGSHRT